MLIQSKRDPEPLSALALFFLCSLPILSAKQWPLPRQLAQCRHRTVRPDPGLLNPESFMEASRSAGALMCDTFWETEMSKEI